MKKENKTLNKMSKLVGSKKSQAGFTIQELLLGSLAGVILLGGSILGLSNLSSNNRIAQAKTVARKETTRAIEYMTSEIEQSSGIFMDIEDDVTNGIIVLPTDAEIANSLGVSTSQVSDFEPVLALTVPGLPEDRPIVYFVGPSPNDRWLGPQLVYRHGPTLNDQGQFTNDWETTPLIDRVSNAVPNDEASCNTDLEKIAISTESSKVAGFYVCLQERATSVATSRKADVANLNLVRNINNTIIETYSGESTAFARSTQNISIDTPPGISLIPPNFFVDSDNTNSDDPNENVVTDRAGILTFELIGTAISCGSQGPDIPVDVHIQLIDSKGNSDGEILLAGTRTFPTGSATEVRVRATLNKPNGPCSSINGRSFSTNDTETVQVNTLLDGDSVPNVGGFAGQSSLEEFLEGFIDGDTDTVTLEPNQAIVFFELGVVGEQNLDNPAFDQQDAVVLITVDPLTESTNESDDSSSN